MKIQKHIANATNDTAKRERERESNSALNLSVSKQVSCHTERSEVSQSPKNTRGILHSLCSLKYDNVHRHCEVFRLC